MTFTNENLAHFSFSSGKCIVRLSLKQHSLYLFSKLQRGKENFTSFQLCRFYARDGGEKRYLLLRLSLNCYFFCSPQMYIDVFVFLYYSNNYCGIFRLQSIFAIYFLDFTNVKQNWKLLIGQIYNGSLPLMMVCNWYVNVPLFYCDYDKVRLSTWLSKQCICIHWYGWAGIIWWEHWWQ